MDNYAKLRAVLDAAFDQCAKGKGAERHANGEPWTDQPIFTIARQVGDGFNAGQAIKKIGEAQQMAARGEYDRAGNEILGAIVYCASLHVLWERPLSNVKLEGGKVTLGVLSGGSLDAPKIQHVPSAAYNIATKYKTGQKVVGSDKLDDVAFTDWSGHAFELRPRFEKIVVKTRGGIQFFIEAFDSHEPKWVWHWSEAHTSYLDVVGYYIIK